MGAQSAVMMKMAGENWQFGKRRISAMSNDEFNKLAANPALLYQIETKELQQIIPSIELSLQSMTPLTSTIVTEMINTFKVGAEATFKYLQSIGDTTIGKIIQMAINIWMPWLSPLLTAIPDDTFGSTTPPVIINAPNIPITLQTQKKKLTKTVQLIKQQNVTLVKHITKKTTDPTMQKFTILLANMSKANQLLNAHIKNMSSKKVKSTQDKLNLKQKVQNQKSAKLKLTNFKKNNRRWGSANKLF